MLKYLCILALASAALAEVSDECLACMCYVSSEGCEMPSPVCQNNVCGPWSITEDYWRDAGRLNGEYYDCVVDWECNENTVRAYLDRYVKDPAATCETYARTHYGGPYGADQDFSLEYWYEVKDCLDYALFTSPPIY